MLGLGNEDLLALLLVAIALGALASMLLPHRRPRKPYNNFSSWPAQTNWRLEQAGQQLNAVMVAPFQKRRLMNAGEYRVFRTIEEDIAAARRGHRVFAQTSLGEVLQSPDDEAFRSINSKRVDILIVDGGGWPILAVEYQGEGHHQGTAAARDAIKKEALRRAGVRYVEIFAADSAEQIRFRVREQLGWPASVSLAGELTQTRAAS